MDRILTEEISQSLGGQISMIRLFFDCTREDLRPKPVGENMVFQPEYYVSLFGAYQYPVKCYSKEPIEGIEDFVRDYMQNKRWKEPHEYVAMAIRSVQMQTFRNWRLIVVDDGSTDGSWAAIDRALGTDPRCTGIRTDNHGVAAARNLAIDRAGDGLIVPLDADDWLYPDALYEFAMAFSHVPGLRLAVPQVHRKGEGIDKIVAHTWRGYESLLKRNFLPNTCWNSGFASWKARKTARFSTSRRFWWNTPFARTAAFTGP